MRNVPEEGSHTYIPPKVIQERFEANVLKEIELFDLDAEKEGQHVADTVLELFQDEAMRILNSQRITMEDPRHPDKVIRGTLGQCLDMIWLSVVGKIYENLDS